MMFSVKYVKTPSRRNTIFNFFGKGAVHLLETGLVLEGMLPRVGMPKWLWAILRLFTSRVSFDRLLCGHTIRTVPYSVIESHCHYRGSHRLVFRIPVNRLVFSAPVDRRIITRQTVSFKLEEPIGGDELSRLIAEHTAVAKTFRKR